MEMKLIGVLLAVLGLLLAVWLRPGEKQETGAAFYTGTWEALAVTEPPEVDFPRALEEGVLVAEDLRPYDGPYLEDGSNEPVTNVAALVVRNEGSRDISSAMITVEQAGKRLHFFLTWLPAGERVLVLEFERAAYSVEPITQCSVTGIRWEAFCREGVLIQEREGGIWQVTNDSGRTVRNLRLRYKLYMVREDCLLGGITYCEGIGALGSGEKQSFLFGTAGRVVAVQGD